jgi:hypothetical protein
MTMRNLFLWCALSTMLFSCSTENTTENSIQNETNDFEHTDIPEDYYVISFLHLGMSMGEVNHYVTELIPNAEKKSGSNELKALWEDDFGVKHDLVALAGLSETLEDITYRMAFDTEELQLLTWNYQSELFSLLQGYFGEPVLNEQEEFTGLAQWFTEDDKLISLAHELNFIEIKIGYINSP